MTWVPKCNHASSLNNKSSGLTIPSCTDRKIQLQTKTLALISGLVGSLERVILRGHIFRSLVAVWADPIDRSDCATDCVKTFLGLPSKEVLISSNFLPSIYSSFFFYSPFCPDLLLYYETFYWLLCYPLTKNIYTRKLQIKFTVAYSVGDILQHFFD
jgi:hypothetical protein